MDTTVVQRLWQCIYVFHCSMQNSKVNFICMHDVEVMVVSVSVVCTSYIQCSCTAHVEATCTR